MRLALARLLACGIPHTCTRLAYGEPPATAPLVLEVRRLPPANGDLGLRPIQRATLSA
jgi:hypothetical protein